MSIDGIGGGGDSPDVLAIRRRALEEQRSRELDNIETRYKKQVDETKLARDKALEHIYESTQDDVDTKSKEAQYKVDRAKLAADERVRRFQESALKMTHEAERQFQSKAKSLEQASRDMEAQRQHLLKERSSSFEKLEQERQEQYDNLSTRYAKNALDIENAHKRRLMKQEDIHKEELRDEQRGFQQSKAMAEAENSRALYNLHRQRQDLQGEIELESSNARRQSEAQLENIKVNQQIRENALGNEHQGNIEDANRRYNLEINRTHARGMRMLNDVRERQISEIAGLEREGRIKVQQTQDTEAAKVSAIENDGKLREYLAKQAFDNQRMLNENSFANRLNEQKQIADALQRKGDENLHQQANAIRGRTEKLLSDQAKQYAKDITYNRKLGQKQLETVMAANAEKVAKYAERSEDPFYRLKKLDASMSQDEQQVTVKVPVPEHEKDQVRLTHQNGLITISSTRRFGGSGTGEAGEKIETHSYQSFSESIPYARTLNIKDMSKTYDGKNIVFTIPKA